MSKVDWSLAPSWCNGYGLIGFHGYPVWFDDDQYQYLASGDVHKFANGCTYTRSELQVIERRKKPWSGSEDGLPPVGLRVEVLWSSVTEEYVQCLILAHDEDRAVFRFVTGNRKGEYQADKLHFSSHKLLPNFRPLKTLEQLASDQRETAIRELMDIAQVDCRVTASKAVDAGFKREVV